MTKNYSYPIEYDLYTTDEIVQLIHFFEQIAQYYETNKLPSQLLENYQIFCNLVTSKSDRTRMYKQFLKDSGYDVYSVIEILTKNSKK